VGTAADDVTPISHPDLLEYLKTSYDGMHVTISPIATVL